jgi:DNA-binding protein H-NS
MQIAKMDFESLMTLRQKIDAELIKHRDKIRQNLRLLGGPTQARAYRKSSLIGTKVPPKYRGPRGETWAGRGAIPRWIKASGKRPEAFLIAGVASAKRRNVKRSNVKRSKKVRRHR